MTAGAFHHTPDLDEATLADRYDIDPPWTPTPHPIPAPCPVCLKHVGHYEERHGDAWCTRPGCTDGNPWHEHKDGAS